MRYCGFLIIFFTLSCLIFSNSVYANDFNIKIRKTDISELKKQLIPPFEQNIQVLKDLLLCLEQGKSVEACLKQLTLTSEQNSQNRFEERHRQIQSELEQKLHQQKPSQEQIIKELKKLLVDAEKVKLCLNQGQTANDLKDCVMQYRN